MPSNDKFPEEMREWRARAEWIQRSFDCPSKAATELLKEFLEFANGDTTCETLTHFCSPGCCSSSEESFQKLLKKIVPLLARGYAVPLLYRIKHFSGAAGYMKFACCAFRLLPRVLAQMEKNAADSSEPGSGFASLVETLLSDHKTAEQPSAEDFQRIVDSLLDSDLSYSLQNSVRRRLVSEQLSKETFLQGAIVIESIINAIEPGVNRLFKRTGCLTRLTALGSSHPDYQSLKETCEESFLQIVSGDFAHDLINRVLGLLDSGLEENVHMGLQPSRQRLMLIFQLVCASVSDLWRRLIQDYDKFPFKLFALLRCSLADFVKEWDQLLHTRCSCPTCLDVEFTIPLLKEFGPEPLRHRALHYQLMVQQEVCEVLSHVASFTPLNSDSVEIKNGQMQWAVSKRSSAMYVKKPSAARETSLLQVAINNHGHAQAEVQKATMPPKRVSAAIRRQVGVRSTNQHSRALENNKEA